jgi:hypothetical protein
MLVSLQRANMSSKSSSNYFTKLQERGGKVPENAQELAWPYLINRGGEYRAGMEVLVNLQSQSIKICIYNSNLPVFLVGQKGARSESCEVKALFLSS